MLNEILDGEWATLDLVVIMLWEPTHDSIYQAGLVTDGTHKIKFTSWKNGSHQKLEIGKKYRFKDVHVTSYNNKLQLNITPQTAISNLKPAH